MYINDKNPRNIFGEQINLQPSHKMGLHNHFLQQHSKTLIISDRIRAQNFNQ